MNTVSRTTSFSLALLLLNAITVFAANGDESDATSWLPFVGIAVILFAAAFFLWKRSQKSDATTGQYDYNNRVQGMSVTYNHEEGDGVDAEKELEWFRKAKRSSGPSKAERAAAQADRQARRIAEESAQAPAEDLDISSRAFQDKMRRFQFAQLPVNSFIQLTEARAFDQLPISSDPALLSAVEQTQDEYEDDESVRELAVKILARFRSRNSIEALSQMALYDLSSNLRSKAVNILTEFGHESVFESILLACADPTREVRAAAARGLFRLNFDRAEAWKRIIGTSDKFRMSHAARAAVESGIAGKSVDRLLHDDMKVAYEAFVLIALLIKADEADLLYDTIRNSADERIKLALLHVFEVVDDESSFEKLSSLRSTSMSEDVSDKLKGILETSTATA